MTTDASGPVKPSPPPVPDHELIRPIGGGSYGEVWLARSVTGQMRAIKIVWRQNFSSDRPYEREFRGIAQFEPISRMHPGVIHILHVGRDDNAGCFYYVMELADTANVECAGRAETVRPPGPAPVDPAAYAPRTLASDLKSHGRLLVIKVVSLGIQLADALGPIHRHGLVHRDVKPSNVIFVTRAPWRPCGCCRRALCRWPSARMAGIWPSAWTPGSCNCGTWPKCVNEFANWEWIGQRTGERRHDGPLPRILRRLIALVLRYSGLQTTYLGVNRHWTRQSHDI